jgi:hypothetical protein
VTDFGVKARLKTSEARAKVAEQTVPGARALAGSKEWRARLSISMRTAGSAKLLA